MKNTKWIAAGAMLCLSIGCAGVSSQDDLSEANSADEGETSTTSEPLRRFSKHDNFDDRDFRDHDVHHGQHGPVRYTLTAFSQDGVLEGVGPQGQRFSARVVPTTGFKYADLVTMFAPEDPNDRRHERPNEPVCPSLGFQPNQQPTPSTTACEQFMAVIQYNLALQAKGDMTPALTELTARAAHVYVTVDAKTGTLRALRPVS